MKIHKFVLSFFALIIALATFAADLTQETKAFIDQRAPQQQTKMAAAIREAIAGNSEKLNVIRQAMLADTPPPAGVKVENQTVGTSPLRLYLPEKMIGKSVVLYLHGGGWTLGMLEGSSRFCGDLANQTGMAVATLSYRLAPEHSHPAALDDVTAAIAMLKKHGYQRIYLSGDSAGGNLAIAGALKSDIPIAGLILYYPVTLAKSDNSASWQKFGVGFGVDAQTMDAFNDAYVKGKQADDPFASPLLAKDLTRMPPTLIIAADHDILFDQGKAFETRLKESNVEVTHRTIPGTIHAFMTYPGMEQAYQYGLELAVMFLKNKENFNMNKVTKDSIVRLSKITVDPAQLDEYMAFATECGTRSMAEEPGVLMMYSMADKTQPNLITILEIYTDKAAYEKHIASPHFQKYKQGTLKMVQQLELLDQTPLIPEMKMK